MINAYHFIQYDNETTLEHILKRSESGATICLDFEDNIRNWIQPADNSNLKKEYRGYFEQIIIKFHNQLNSCKIGVRLNSDISGELLPDLNMLQLVSNNIKISCLFLPKTESVAQVRFLLDELQRRQINYDEIIPIVESPKGLGILNEILEVYPDRIRNIAFGHCDYNLSIKAFPFIHQDCCDYWKWVEKMYSIIEPYGVTLINSAFLQLENHEFFDIMLSYMKSICGNNFGQATLTYRQSLQCENFSASPNADYKLIKPSLLFNPETSYAENLMATFRNRCNYRGHSVVTDSGILISPQEYLLATNYLSAVSAMKMELYFVGGCFAQQPDILLEDNFLYRIRNKIAEDANVDISITIIRYEKISSCLEKFHQQHIRKKADVLVFHIRPEPFLRMSKFYYKYKNHEGKIRRSISLGAFNIILSESYDCLETGMRFPETTMVKKLRWRRVLIDMNYFMGLLTGNHYFAFRKYCKVVGQLGDYCSHDGIVLIVLGPVARAETKWERIFSMRFVRKTEKYFRSGNLHFVSGIDVSSKYQKEYFKPDGIYANEKYHNLIAQRILAELLKGKNF